MPHDIPYYLDYLSPSLLSRLESDGESLPVLLRRMAQYLANKQQPANWDDVRALLFYQSGDTGEDVRLQIARPYYRTLHAQEQGD